MMSMNQYAQAEHPQYAVRTYDGLHITPEVSLILIERQGMSNIHDLTGRTFLAVAHCNAPVLLISQSSAQGNFCFVVPRESAACVLEAVTAELSAEITQR